MKTAAKEAAVAGPSFCSKVIPAPLPTTTLQKASGWNRRPAPIHTKPEVRSKPRSILETQKDTEVEQWTQPPDDQTHFQLWLEARHRKKCLPPPDIKSENSPKDTQMAAQLPSAASVILPETGISNHNRLGRIPQNHPIQFLCLGATKQQQWQQQQNRRGGRERQQHRIWFCCPSSTQNKNAPAVQ